ncbi:MAG: thioredoxin domain-containing protein [Sphingomonas sp.]
MKSLTMIAASTLALALAGCGDGGSDLNALANETANAGPLTQIAAPNNGDWTQVVSQTPEGGYRMGNPNAPVQLVEYASLTCPHCRDFSAQATAALRDNYVRSGQVSWEFRNFLLGAPDVALSVLARCQPDAAFFSTVEQIYVQQAEFLQAIDENEARAISALPPEQQIPPLARAMDLESFFARRGMPAARFGQCVGNTTAIRQLTENTSRAMTERQVRGTPTFFINGEQTNADTWARLEPLLRGAIGG